MEIKFSDMNVYAHRNGKARNKYSYLAFLCIHDFSIVSL